MAVWPAEVRKTVTVLFCDVTGSTDLGERLDPEALRRVMFRFFDEMRAVLERHGGTVEKYAGDDVMAVFGVPTLHEDDALRAVHAAKAMQAALAELNEELERGWGVRLDMRVGVNTGEVVASHRAGDATLVTGDAVNLAKRIQQAAAPGEVLLGKATYRLIRDDVHAGPLESFSVKERLVSPWRLLDSAAPLQPRLEAPLVGREVEQRVLREHYDRAVAEQRCRLVTVIAPAGVGKSRLARELGQQLLDASVVKGRCLPYGEGITFWPVREIVHQTAQVAAGDTAEAARSKVAALFSDADEAEAVCRTLAGAIGLGQDAVPTEEIFWSVRRLLETLARKRPLMLVVEDIHWAEPTLLDLLHYLEGWTSGAPVLLLCLARPELLDLRPWWAAASESVVLEPLTESETQALVAALAGEEAARAAGRVAQAAEGNPLFAEELLRMLVEDDALAGDEPLAVPPTINAVLAARLDRLEPDERTIVQCAAVIGRHFSWAAVGDLAPDELRPRVAPVLQALVRKKIVVPDETTTFGEDAFRFAHMLMRDAAYQALPKGQRADLHERHAESLDRHRDGRAAEYDEILGYHLEQAYMNRAELGPIDAEMRASAQRGGVVLTSAGRRALGRGDSPAAANLLQRALVLTEAAGDPTAHVLVVLGAALRESGRLPDAMDVLSDAMQLARDDGDGSTEARARIECSFTRLYTEGHSLTAVEEVARRAEALAPDDEVVLANARMLEATLELLRCRFAAAEKLLEEAFIHAGAADDRQQARLAVGLLARTALMGPRPVEDALARIDELTSRAPGDRMIDATTALARGRLEAMRGRFDEGRRLYDHAQTLFAELGRTLPLAAGRTDSAAVELLAGDAPAAVRELHAGLEAASALGDKGSLSTLAALLAETLAELGEVEEAERQLEVSEAETSEEDILSRILQRVARARLLLNRRSVDDAEAASRDAVALAEETDSPLLQADALATRSLVLHARGDAAGAAQALREAARRYEAKGDSASLERLRRLQAVHA